jgi:hypothetical protein
MLRATQSHGMLRKQFTKRSIAFTFTSLNNQARKVQCIHSSIKVYNQSGIKYCYKSGVLKCKSKGLSRYHSGLDDIKLVTCWHTNDCEKGSGDKGNRGIKCLWPGEVELAAVGKVALRLAERSALIEVGIHTSVDKV